MTAKPQTMTFEIVMEPDEGGFHIWCPALPGCHSFGETREEAIANIQEAMELWLDSADPVENPILDREMIAVHVRESATPRT